MTRYEHDAEERWIVENDGEGASRIVARDVLPSFGEWIADSFDAAWAEAEAALPEGCTMSLYWQLGLWHASYQHKHTECPGCGIIHQCEPERETVNWPATGPTPAAALRALAEKLREAR